MQEQGVRVAQQGPPSPAQGKGVIPEHFFDVCHHESELLPGHTTVLETWNCNSTEWDFVACGKDMEPPKEEIGEIEVSPTCDPRSAGQGDNLIYGEFIPSRKVSVETAEFEFDFRREQYFRFRKEMLGRRINLWRIVAMNPTQTFFLWKGFIKSSHPKFPADAESVATTTLTIRPTGATYQGDLIPDAA